MESRILMIPWLTRSIDFPDVDTATEDGVVAVGGDLSPARLLEAYRRGIFPWYSHGQPVIWWSPDPRAVLPLDGLRVGRTLNKVLRRNFFQVTFDQAFDRVVQACVTEHREPRGGGWLTPEMATAYGRLHRLGYAHSVETWKDGTLAGGLYGVGIHGFFAGESMFYRVSDASKVALVALVERMRRRGMRLLDCQMLTPVTRALGAIEISRRDYCILLSEALKPPAHF